MLHSFIYDEETKRVARHASETIERCIIRDDEEFEWIKEIAAVAARDENIGNCARFAVSDIIGEIRATALDIGSANGPVAEATAAVVIRVIEKLPYIGGVPVDPRGEKEDRARARAEISRILDSVG